jgi:hypothetical protein
VAFNLLLPVNRTLDGSVVLAKSAVGSNTSDIVKGPVIEKTPKVIEKFAVPSKVFVPDSVAES